jgi:molybdopterin converting factor small subunit
MVIYKGGISKLTGCKEERLDFKADLSLDAALATICQKHNFTKEDHLINQGSVLLTLNGEFIPTWQAGDIKLKPGDVVTLFPTVSGG